MSPQTVKNIARLDATIKTLRRSKFIAGCSLLWCVGSFFINLILAYVKEPIFYLISAAMLLAIAGLNVWIIRKNNFRIKVIQQVRLDSMRLDSAQTFTEADCLLDQIFAGFHKL